mmetsp:Transcript_6022/g.13658  ORF Transcript_6022/g.13658 Transcript_6022/m.13658 type:complete len:93 (+) Transcript_6022:848-1126(+)
MALAPLGTSTNDGVSLNSEGISQTVVELSSPPLALNKIGLRAVDVVTNALVVSGDHAIVARVATEVSTLISRSDDQKLREVAMAVQMAAQKQ